MSRNVHTRSFPRSDAGAECNSKRGTVPRRTGVFVVLRVFILLVTVVVTAGLPATLRAHDPNGQSSHNLLSNVDFEQRLDAELPLDVTFRDEAGRAVQLGDYFGDRPIILALGYYECPNLCSLVRRGLLDSLQQINFTVGEEFDVLAVSIDPEESAEIAAETKQQYVQAYARAGAADGWHFLTGQHGQIDRLADAVGFHYTYDPAKDQYAHASGIVIVTPEGRVARYLYGLEYEPRNLRLALVEATENKIGSPVDQVLLFCYHYDPTTGKYSLLINRVLQLAGTGTVLALGTFLVVMIRRERRGEFGGGP